MFTVIKVLNNNAILSSDGTSEAVFLGRGIGFNKKSGDTFENIENSKCYRLAENTSKGKSIELIDGIKPVFLEITSEILDIAEKRFGKVDNSVIVTLADHIAFSIDRMKNNMVLENPFTDEIKFLFSDEYEVALMGRKIIKDSIGFEISDDEVGYITLHIHSALSNDKISKSMKITMIIREMIETLEKEYNTEIKTDSLSYSRLMNHVKFMLARISKDEKLNLDINEYTMTNFNDSYKIAYELCDSISKEIDKEIDELEVGYLALHIERIKTSLIGNNN